MRARVHEPLPLQLQLLLLQDVVHDGVVEEVVVEEEDAVMEDSCQQEDPLNFFPVGKHLQLVHLAYYLWKNQVRTNVNEIGN